MTDIDPTPSTPVTIGDRLAWWRDELRQALTALRSDEHHSLRGIANAITLAYMNIQGTQNKTLTHVDDRLATLQDTVYDGLYIQGEVANYPAHIRLNAELQSISERLEYIQAGIGAEPYESLEIASVRGLLQALLSNASASTYGLAPISRPDDNGSAGDAYVNGRVYAMWSDLPPSLTVDTQGIVLTGDWNGWAVYVQTSDPEPRKHTSVADPGSVFAANRWVYLYGVGSNCWSVSQQYTIRVYLRPPLTSGYLDFVSAMVTVNDPKSPRPAVVWGTSTTYQTTNVWRQWTWSQAVMLLGNFKGAVVSCDSTSANYLRVGSLHTTTGDTYNTVSQGNMFTVTRDTTALAIDNHNVRNLSFSGRIQWP